MKQWLRKILPNPLEKILCQARKESKKKFLLFWNRGLGDIPLGLYGLCKHIRHTINDAKITFLTRKDLEEGFSLLQKVDLIIDPNLQRGGTYDLDYVLSKLKKEGLHFDILIKNPDPTRWLYFQLGRVTPKLDWNPHWDHLSTKFHLQERCIGVHINTETGSHYNYEKNWPIENWKALLQRLTKTKVLLFGLLPSPAFSFPHVIDLRGKTTLLEMIAIIRNHCHTLIAPDSGVLSIIYYIDQTSPLKVISLWADPKQGVLRQKVPSPNSHLYHLPIIAPAKQMRNILVDRVEKAILYG